MQILSLPLQATYMQMRKKVDASFELETDRNLIVVLI